MSTRVAILTRTRDFHAHAIGYLLGRRGIRCSLIETDELAARGGMSWGAGGPSVAQIVDVHGDVVEIASLDLTWFRRLNGEPSVPATIRDPAARDLIARDCRATLLGLFDSEFRGVWISEPEATRRAENKLVQLRAAVQTGLRVPRTLVSQDPASVRGFCQGLDYRTVVKTVSGTPLTPLLTGRVSPELVDCDEAISISPAIYQELIPGDRHLRMCCFGEDVHCVMLETDRLDWRIPLDARASSYRAEKQLADSARQLLARLGLRMGIFDFKLTPADEAVFLELNPQGQFLFLEDLCEVSLGEPFADFLVRELDSGKRNTPAEVAMAQE